MTLKMNKIMHPIAALLFMAATAATVSARTTVNLSGRESTGFNALDHTLQKPLGNPSFPAGHRFGDGLFIGAGIGTSIIGDDFSGGIRPGIRAGGHLGGWITPVHGIRLGADVGLLSVHKGIGRTWFGAARADYLTNLSSLLYGYKPDRRFELISAIGLEYQRTCQTGYGWGHELGIEAALQCRFNVASSMYVFIEPRLVVQSGTHYDHQYDWRRFKSDVSLNVGLGYRILSGRMRAMGSTPFKQINDDNLYFGAGGGVLAMTRENFPSAMVNGHNLIASAFAGKMLSSTSALQFDINFGRFRMSRPTIDNRMLSIASLDYVLNLDNAFGGYHPENVFQLLLNVGVSAGMANAKLAPGANAGLTGMFRLTDNWGLYIKPQAHFFSSRFARELNTRQAPLASLSVGVRYTIGDFSRLHPESYETYNTAKHWFLTTALSAGYRPRGDYGPGMSAIAGFGKQFTPVSSWRLSLDGAYFPRWPRYIGLTGHLDYLTSITSAMYGYDPDRVFDLQLVLGALGGVGTHHSPAKIMLGLKGGLQANFRLNSSLDLFVEPVFLVTNTPINEVRRHWVPEVRAYVGLKYRLGTPEGRGYMSDTPYGPTPYFAGIATGPSVYSQSLSRENFKISGLLEFSVGRWFSMVSGARLVYSNDWLRSWNRSYYSGALHADYLLNLTSLMERRSSRTFHIIGAAGIGMGFSSKSYSPQAVGPMAYGGVQFRFNLPHNFDFHIEPGANFIANRISPAATRHRFAIAGHLAVGTSYRF